MKPLHTPADNRRRAAFDPNISAVKLAALASPDMDGPFYQCGMLFHPPVSLENMPLVQAGKP